MTAGATRPGRLRLVTLDPGHFHAALVQRTMYPQIAPEVRVFAPEGPDLALHLERIEAYERREVDPTAWEEIAYAGPDYLERMLEGPPGSLVVISGCNSRKAEYILESVRAGHHVLADKPMVIRPEQFPTLVEAYRLAGEKGVLLADIMTERYEITSIVQRELAHVEPLFGALQPGTEDAPAICKESVHHFSKVVSGRPLTRPAWYFDVEQQGEGIVDVTTHLVDLVHWQCFPGEAVDHATDVEVLAAERWATTVTREQFRRVTGLADLPEFLEPARAGDALEVFANGRIDWRVRGVHARVSVRWDYEAPPGGGDTHHSVMQGSRSRLVVRQGAEQAYRPELYVEPLGGGHPPSLEGALDEALAVVSRRHPGLSSRRCGVGWEVQVPEALREGHEDHFARVMRAFLEALDGGGAPEVEVAGALARYFVTTRALALARSGPGAGSGNM